MATYARQCGRPTRRRLTALFGALVLLTLLAACSRVSFFYHTADIFIESYADDYLALDRMQLAGWRPTLRDALARHRQEELPYLARFFDTAHAGVVNGFSTARVNCLLDQFVVLYQRHLHIASDLAAPLLAGLTPQQIRRLEAEFAKQNAELPENVPAASARRAHKRAERYAESLEWWLGSVNAEQKSIIQEVTAAMPDTARDWATYRGKKQAGLIALLDREADSGEIRRYLAAWVVQFRDLPPRLRTAQGQMQQGIRALLLRMDASLSPEQRRHFAARLRSLRDDFMSLQARPRMAAVQCAQPI